MTNCHVQINQMIIHHKGLEHSTVSQKINTTYKILLVYLCQVLANTFGVMPNIKAVEHCCEIVSWYKPEQEINTFKQCVGP